MAAEQWASAAGVFRARGASACLCLCVCLLSAQQVLAEAKPTIRWLMWDQLPNFILSGPFKGQGVAGSLTRVLQDSLPQYLHVDVISNAQRYHKLIREPDTCAAWAWIVPGSQAFRLHSRAVSLAPRTGIQVLKTKRALFGEAGASLSLAVLLSKPELKLGYLKGMTYSRRVNQLLDEYAGQANIYASSISSVEFKLPMLDRGRVDYFFGFSAQSIYDAELKGIENKYQFYNLLEMAEYTSMYSHCAKSAFGEQVMAEIEALLSDELLLAHLQVMERWYGVNLPYRQVFMEHVIKRQANPLVTDPGQ